MAYLEIHHVEIKGVAVAVPKQLKIVKEIPYFTEQEADNFTKVTGVEHSHIVPKGMTCSDLCQAAAENLLKTSGWERASIDLICFVSVSRDFYICPNTSNILQNKLGLSEECMAIDLPFACSGYVHGLATVASLLQNGSIRRALLLVGETPSANQSLWDKAQWPLHGDAGSATLLEYNAGAEHPMQFHLCSDGSGYNAIICKEMGVRYPSTPDSFQLRKDDDDIEREGWQSKMDGMSVFSFAITKPVKCIKGLAERFGFDIPSVDYLVIHQANRMIDEKLRRKLKLTPEQVPYSMSHYGNTSSCTIPLTMASRLHDTLSTKENELVMCGFGSGLSWGAAHVFTNKIICNNVFEI